MERALLRILIAASVFLAMPKTNPNSVDFKDPELEPFFTTFAFEAGKRKIALPGPVKVVFVPKIAHHFEEGDHIIGLCEYSSKRHTAKISIEREYFDKADDFARESLLYHEFGHCLLDKDHNEAVDNGVPLSVMHSYLIDSKAYREQHDRYLDELFAK